MDAPPSVCYKSGMCLAIPGEIVAIEENGHGLRMGRASFGGVQKTVCLEYTPEAGVGDFVIVHVGFALSVIDADEAARTYALLEEIGQLEEPG